MTENTEQKVVQLDFDVPYRDIKVGDEVVRLKLTDEVRINFAFDIKEAFKAIEDKSKQAKSLMDKTREEELEEIEEVKTLLKPVYDNSLGEGTFDRVYEAAGESTPNCLHLLGVCLDIIQEFDDGIAKNVQTRKVNKYLKNKNSRQKSK